MKKAVYAVPALGVSGLLYHFQKKRREEKELSESICYEAFMKMVSIDNRFVNYCGRQNKISKVELIEDKEKSKVFKVTINGIRGTSTVQFNVQKVTHQWLLDTSNSQAKYSLMSKDEKMKNIFIPSNLIEIFPTNETIHKYKNLNENFKVEIERVVETLKNSREETKINQFIKSIQANNNLSYPRLPNSDNLILSPNDTFWKVNSIVMNASDSLVYNLRPVSPKFRNFEIEDSHYNYRTILDPLYKLYHLAVENSSQYVELKQTDFNRNELLIRKKTNFDKSIEKRNQAMMINFSLLVILVGASSYFSSKRINVEGFKQLKEILSKEVAIKQRIGSNFEIISANYEYFIRKDYYKFTFYVYGTTGKAVVTSHLEFNSVSDSHIMSEIIVESKSYLPGSIPQEHRILDTLIISPNEIHKLV